MARRTKVVTISDEKSRDYGKSFMVTEMPSDQAEWWAIRVLQGLLGSSADIDIGIFGQPLAELARYSFLALAKVPHEQLKPILDEMKGCITVLLPDGKTTRALLPNEVEDFMTWIELRREVFGVLTGFFEQGDE